jgi:hypothetical protein
MNWFQTFPGIFVKTLAGSRRFQASLSKHEQVSGFSRYLCQNMSWFQAFPDIFVKK